MRWRGGRRSDNIEDRRGQGGVGFGGMRGGGMRGGGLLGLLLSGRLGKLGFLIAAGLVAAALFGVDLGGILGVQDAYRQPVSESPGPGAQPKDELADFVSVVLADTEDTWSGLLRAEGGRYREPTLVLFRDRVRSACGIAGSATGPFYCPGDEKIYIDLSFYQALRDRLGAPGDFAQAYVIAHEVGHHVQTLLGISEQVRAAKRKASEVDANRLSVRQELQADCFAGLWAHHAEKARKILEAGDIQEALTAASAIGDDRLQRRSQGTVTPDSFTHGTSEQRVRWFRTGFERGRLDACNTFAAARL